MYASAAAGLACGAILGSRYKVFILVPAHLLAIAVLAGVAANETLGASWAMLASVLWSVGCNVGYLLAAIVTAEAAPRRDHAPVSQPLRRARP